MRNWIVPLGVLILLLSSCASQQDLVDLQRQLQTTRGELAAVRKQVTETKTLVGGYVRDSENERKEFASRIKEQMTAVLSSIEAQQKAIASLNALAQEKFSAADARNEERLKKLEERIEERARGYLGSQGNLGSRFEELAAEVRIVQGKLEENNNLLAEQGARLDELNEQARRQGGKIETGGGELRLFRETQASYGEKLRVLEKEVASLVKGMEEWRRQADRAFGDEVKGLKEKLGVVEGELRLLRESYGRLISSASAGGVKEKEVEKGASPSPFVGREAGSGAEGGSAAISPGGDRIYNAAYADFLRGAYGLALSGFRDYLAKYPKGSLAANSQYWMGECYYSQKKFKEAIDEFEAVIKNYPKSAKASGALLKKGYSYLALGDAARAKSTLAEVLEKYPKTREAGLAEDQLGKMR